MLTTVQRNEPVVPPQREKSERGKRGTKKTVGTQREKTKQKTRRVKCEERAWQGRAEARGG